MAPAPITVRRFDDYVAKLEQGEGRPRRRPPQGHHPRTAPATRRSRSASSWSRTRGCWRRSPAWSNGRWCWSARFDEAFLEIPPEVIRATIRANQKCFVLRAANGESRIANSEGSDSATRYSPFATRSSLAPRFILVANIEASDGGKAIVAGNERVIRARLVRRPLFLGDRPEAAAGQTSRQRSCKAARPAAGEARRAEHRLPREARHAGRARRAHRPARRRDRRRCRPPDSSRQEALPDSSRRAAGLSPKAERAATSPRPISSPRWSASSPSCRA